MKRPCIILLILILSFIQSIGFCKEAQYPQPSELEQYKKYVQVLKKKGMPVLTPSDEPDPFPYENTIAFIYRPVEGLEIDFSYENRELLRYHVSINAGTVAYAYQFDIFVQFILLVQPDLSDEEAIGLYMSLVHDMERQLNYPFFFYSEEECENAVFRCLSIYHTEYESLTVSLYAEGFR